MTLPPRRVILASITGRTVALSPAPNGSGLTSSDIRQMCAVAVGDVKGSPRVTYIGLSSLPDLEAYCESRGVVVQRIDRGRGVVVSLGSPRCHATGKVSYTSKARAKRRARATGGTLSVYECPGCSGYHLGHLQPDVVAGDRARSDRETMDARNGLADRTVRRCPECAGEGTARVGVLHARGCAREGVDPLNLPRRP